MKERIDIIMVVLNSYKRLSHVPEHIKILIATEILEELDSEDKIWGKGL